MDTPQYARRTPEEITAAAEAIDRAIAAGVPDRVIRLILAARGGWWGDATWPPISELVEILACPEAAIVDEVVFQAVKARVRASTRKA